MKGSNVLADRDVSVFTTPPEEEAVDRVTFTTLDGRWTYTEDVASALWGIESGNVLGFTPGQLLTPDGVTLVTPKLLNRCHT